MANRVLFLQLWPGKYLSPHLKQGLGSFFDEAGFVVFGLLTEEVVFWVVVDTGFVTVVFILVDEPCVGGLGGYE